MHLVGISGSTRAASYNTALLRAAFDDLPDGVTAEISPLAGIPMYDWDDEKQRGFPEAVEELRAKVDRSDAILFASPEYNFSVTGALKNAIDWLSRGPSSPIDYKPAAVVGAGGGSGTRWAQQHLRRMLQHNRLRVLAGPDVLVAHARAHFDGLELADDRVRTLLRRVVDGLVDLASAEFTPPTTRGAVLAVAPDAASADTLARPAAERAFRTIAAASAVDAARAVADRSIAAVVLDGSLDRGERIVIGAALDQHQPGTTVLVANDPEEAARLLDEVTGVRLASG
jgi:chromate reductase, NAD(P)H dehydrogenase (quinone)